MRLEDVDLDAGAIPFLLLAIDWFFLDRWDQSSTLSKRTQGMRLARDFQALGDSGRQPYEDRCRTWQTDNILSPNTETRLVEVPHDILTDQERSAAAFSESRGAIIRTAYPEAAKDDANTDGAGAEVQHHLEEIAQGIQCYNAQRTFADPALHAAAEWKEIAALIPSLYDLRDDWTYAEKGPGRSWVVIIDEEALATGMMLFCFLDQHGRVLPYSERRLPSQSGAIEQCLDLASGWIDVGDFTCWQIVNSVDELCKSCGVDPPEESVTRWNNAYRMWEEEVLGNEEGTEEE